MALLPICLTMMNIKKHFLGIFFSVLVGLIYLSPHLIIPFMQRKYMNNESYQYTYRSLFKDWNNYEGTPAGQFLKDGQVAEGVVWEHRNGPSVFPPVIPTFMVGITARLFGSVTNSFIFGKFLWNFSAAMLIYVFLFLITKNSTLSSIGTIFASIGSFTTQAGSQIHSLFEGFRSAQNTFQPFLSMLPNQNFDYYSIHIIFFLIAVIFFYLAFKSQRKSYLILTGIAGGSLFYVVPYYWTTFIGGVVLTAGYFFIKRDVKNLFNFSLVLILMIIIAIPYAIEYSQWKDMPAAADFITSHTCYFGRTIDPLSIAYLIFIALVYYLIGNKKTAEFQTISFLSVSAILWRNVQVIIGYNINPVLWTARVLDILIIILTIYFIHCFTIKNYNIKISILNNIGEWVLKYYKSIGMAIACVFILSSFWNMTKYSTDPYIYKEKTFLPGYAEAYKWLNGNTERDSTVLTLLTEANDDLPVYTHNLSYCAFFNINIYTVPEKERLERFYIASRTMGVTGQTLKYLLDLGDDGHNKQLESELKKIKMDLIAYEAAELPIALLLFRYKWYRPYYNYNFEKDLHIFKPEILKRIEKGEFIVYIPEDIKLRMIEDYKYYCTQESWKLFKKYRLNYVLVGPFEKKIGNTEYLEKNGYLKKVYENDYGVQIYKVLI